MTIANLLILISSVVVLSVSSYFLHIHKIKNDFLTNYAIIATIDFCILELGLNEVPIGENHLLIFERDSLYLSDDVEHETASNYGYKLILQENGVKVSSMSIFIMKVEHYPEVGKKLGSRVEEKLIELGRKRLNKWEGVSAQKES